MKKIVPFKKDLIFKTNVSEITSISLEHSLHVQDEYIVNGSFIINGEYKINDNSEKTEVFNFELPFDISIDDKYDTSKVVIDIDDFYYEIADNNKLLIHIDVLIDNLEEKPLPVPEERCIEEEYPFEDIMKAVPAQIEEVKEEIKEEVAEKEPIKKEEKVENNTDSNKTIFDTFDNEGDKFTSYYVYIMRENDSVESVIQKYNISKDLLELYNNISEIKIGDKIIIPATNNETV